MVAPPVPTLLYFYWYLHAFLTNLEKCYTHIHTHIVIYICGGPSTVGIQLLDQFGRSKFVTLSEPFAAGD